jgi:hypothetical protein
MVFQKLSIQLGKMNIMPKWSALLLHIWEAPLSNLDPKTGSPTHNFVSLSVVLYAPEIWSPF